VFSISISGYDDAFYVVGSPPPLVVDLLFLFLPSSQSVFPVADDGTPLTALSPLPFLERNAAVNFALFF